MHYTGNRWHLPPLLRLIRNLSMSDIHSSFNCFHKGWIEREDLPCGKDFNISRKVRMTSLLKPSIQFKRLHGRIGLCENGKIKKNWTIWNTLKMNSFQTGTRFCERVKRILLKSPPRIIKVVRLLFIQRVRQDIRSIVRWDLYLHTTCEIVSKYNFWVCWPTKPLMST